MDWKKILKASFIPVAILFFILLIGELAYKGLPSYTQYAIWSDFGLWYLGSTILIFITIGYVAVRKYNLEVTGLIVTGVLAIFFFIIAQAAMTIISECNWNLNSCNLPYYIRNGIELFLFLEVLGLNLGWSLALIVQRIKPREKPEKKKKLKQV